ncbi:MAG: protein kinase, partial [Planctomycetes bacterium]|nr:protein kinase [Planctomycetota bacterium]
DAIAAAHDAGIVHRDLKPSNLFVESTGRAVVLDFGIVSLSAKATLSLHESSIGTPAYMAPEQMRRESEPDARTDVYGLTATLYHLVTGHAPFEGTPHQVLATLQRREPPPADEHRPGLPRDLLAILEKGMATSPSNRYAGARALRDDLRAFLEYRPVMARRASAVERLVRRVWRSPAMKASGAVLALVAMAAVSYVWIVAAQRNRNEAWDRDSITVPPSLLAGRPSFREVSAVTKSDRVANLLDRLVENGSEPLTSTAWRAIHRIDRGQLAAAAADLGSLAGTAGNAPLTAWAASRLRQGHVPDLTIESLPEDAAPTGTIDLIVGAMLQLRGNRLDAAVPRELLDRIPNDERPRGFHEMHFMCRLHELVRSREPRDTRLANARELATDVERYIGTRGVMSAVCGHVLGNALSAQRRHFEGEDVLQRTMQLTPEDPAPRIVLGGILYELGNYGPAITVLEQAVALQPRTIQSREQLVKSLAWLERYEEADKVLSQIPYDDSPRMQGQRSRLVGTLAYIRAAHANAGADRDSVSAFAREAKLHFEEASRLGIRQATFESAVCDWILTPENATRSRLILLAAREALNPYRLRSLAAQLNDPLDAEETQAFRTFLLQQAELRLAEDATHTPH